MRGWTSKMRADRYPKAFNLHGTYKGGVVSAGIYATNKNERSTDTENRCKIVEEIHKRCQDGETVEDVANEIAQREEVKEQFDYYIKNGITDLASIFANWYKSKQKGAERDAKIKGIR